MKKGKESATAVKLFPEKKIYLFQEFPRNLCMYLITIKENESNYWKLAEIFSFFAFLFSYMVSQLLCIYWDFLSEHS